MSTQRSDAEASIIALRRASRVAEREREVLREQLEEERQKWRELRLLIHGNDTPQHPGLVRRTAQIERELYGNPLTGSVGVAAMVSQLSDDWKHLRGVLAALKWITGFLGLATILQLVRFFMSGSW